MHTYLNLSVKISPGVPGYHRDYNPVQPGECGDNPVTPVTTRLPGNYILAVITGLSPGYPGGPGTYEK